MGFDPKKAPTFDDLPFASDEEEALARVQLKRSIQATPEGHVKLYHPELGGLIYGPGGLLEDGSGLIRFGAVEPHFAVVPVDHPLLDPDDPMSIFRRDNRVVVIEIGNAETAGKRVEAPDDSKSDLAIPVAPTRKATAPRRQARKPKAPRTPRPVHVAAPGPSAAATGQ